MADDPKKPNSPFLHDVKGFDPDRIAADFNRGGFGGRGKEFMGAAGAGAQLGMRDIVGGFNQMAGGELGRFSGGEFEHGLRTAGHLGARNGMAFGDIANLAAQGAQGANQRGMDPRLGLQTALSATAFGKAFGDTTEGRTGMNRQTATRLDQELRMSAAQSPLANAMGAAMAMAQAGVLKGPMQQQLMSKDAATRDKALMAVGGMGPAGFMEAQKQLGADGNTVASFLNAKGANQEQISKFGIADKVRQFQGAEMGGEMSRELENSLNAGMRGAGMDRGQRRQVAHDASERMAAALQKMKPEEVADPVKRNGILGAALGQLPGGVDRNQLVAGAVRNLEEKFRSDPQLGRLGGLENALALNRKDILKKGADELQQAGAAANNKDLNKMPEVAKDNVKKLDKAQEGPPAPGQAAAGAGGGQVIKVQFAKLTINQDGGGELDVPGVGAA